MSDINRDVLNGDRLMTPHEVARILRVDPKTVGRWANAGRIRASRTPGGHRRYRASDIRALLEAPGPDGAAHSLPAGPGTT